MKKDAKYHVLLMIAQFDQVIREACDKDKIIERYTYEDSSTTVVGVYKMQAILFGLNYVLGSPIPTPKHIKENKNIVSLDDIKNNMWFWACLALYFLRKEKKDDGIKQNNRRYINKAKELFFEYYGNKSSLEEKELEEKYKNYPGMGFNEIKDVEEYFDVAINTIELNEDGTAHVIKFSEHKINDESKKIWLNVYLTHFSLITNINALQHKVVCERCNKCFKSMR